VHQVLEQQCQICRDSITHAATLWCGHMMCLNCVESHLLQKCPWCQAPLLVKALSNLMSISYDRRVPIDQEMRDAIMTANADRPTTETQQRNHDAITAALRDNGVEDPEAFLEEQRRQGRRGNRRLERRYTEGTSEPNIIDSQEETSAPIEYSPSREVPVISPTVTPPSSPSDRPSTSQQRRSEMAARAAEAAQRRLFDNQEQASNSQVQIDAATSRPTDPPEAQNIGSVQEQQEANNIASEQEQSEGENLQVRVY